MTLLDVTPALHSSPVDLEQHQGEDFWESSECLWITNLIATLSILVEHTIVGYPDLVERLVRLNFEKTLLQPLKALPTSGSVHGENNDEHAHALFAKERFEDELHKFTATLDSLESSSLAAQT